MNQPFDHLPASAHWQTGVADQNPAALEGLYLPKFPITPDTAIMTAGSCFAQHVHRNLTARGWNVIDTETPALPIPRNILARYGYGLYSARYGNIYTARQMVQLLQEAQGTRDPAEAVWDHDGRYFDAQRPNVEPTGLERSALVMEARAAHLKKVLRAVRRADVFVFTLGLTETWQSRVDGTVYPTAPGTLAGQYDPDRYAFHNFTVPEIREDLETLRQELQGLSPGIRMVLTVSPVPLTATATGKHVLPATSYSKAVLRAAAGEISDIYEDVDYFPSFELITNPAANGAFYKPNLRSVTEAGVAAAMHMFFSAHDPEGKTAPSPTEDDPDAFEEDVDLICEEALIEGARDA